VVTLTAAPAAGSQLSGWAGCPSSSGNQCTVTMDQTRSVTATFNVAPPRALNVFPQGGGSGSVASGDGTIACLPTCGHTYADGTVVTLTAIPATGSSFGGWGGDCAGTGVCQLTMNSDKFVTANFDSNPPTVTPPPPDPTTQPQRTCKKKKGKKKRKKKKKRC
jgi:hypothetical protein